MNRCQLNGQAAGNFRNPENQGNPEINSQPGNRFGAHEVSATTAMDAHFSGSDGQQSNITSRANVAAVLTHEPLIPSVNKVPEVSAEDMFRARVMAVTTAILELEELYIDQYVRFIHIIDGEENTGRENLVHNQATLNAALNVACSYKSHINIVRLCLKAGARVDTSDSCHTALAHAVYSRNTEAVGLLLAYIGGIPEFVVRSKPFSVFLEQKLFCQPDNVVSLQDLCRGILIRQVSNVEDVKYLPIPETLKTHFYDPMENYPILKERNVSHPC